MLLGLGDASKLSGVMKMLNESQKDVAEDLSVGSIDVGGVKKGTTLSLKESSV